MSLVENRAVARVGGTANTLRGFNNIEPNVVVFSIACVALLFAEEGKPSAIQSEDEFFAIVGALITPRLEKITTLISTQNVAALTAELNDIHAMY